MSASTSQSPRAVDYHIAWISAIVKEYTIACALLDEEYNAPSDLCRDGNCYTFGRIGQHNVVMACLPLASIGTSRAAGLAAELQRTFPYLKLGLMVGIAGGAPSRENDIRLGDIVVSQPDGRRRCGGIMHYNFGRAVQGVAFEPTSSLNQPHKILLNAAAKLKADHERRGTNIARIAEGVIEKNSPRLDAYKIPKSLVDVLYESSFTHDNEQVSCNESCLPTDENIVRRLARQHDQNTPMIHYGIVGSADVLMRDATLRDAIAQRDGVLCFEMESAGLMGSELRCLVVRGICDYSDSHKNDVWQKYAALVAAAYAKELLDVVPSQQIHHPHPSLEQRQMFPRRKLDILQVLRYENMNDKHDYVLPPVSYSHQWIWRTSLNYWLATPEDEPFWVCGKPGSGKSTLMAYLVHSQQTLIRLQDRGASYKILHFFYDCRAGSGLANNIKGMLRVFLFQLADQFESVRKRLEKLDSENRLVLDTEDSLLDLVCQSLKAPSSKLCVFIDGLDEYEGDLFELIQTCKRLKDWTGVKMCFASRPEAPVSEVFRLYAKILMQDHNKASMYGYASTQLLRVSSEKPEIVSAFTISLQDDLIEKAEGIILWFKLAFDEIIANFALGMAQDWIRHFIEQIPQGLDAIYQRILDRMPQEHVQEAALLLFLIQQLRDLNQDIHDLSVKGELSTIRFSATDMDHIWGVYDFMSEMLSNDIGTHRLPHSKALQARIKLVLAGLVEVYIVAPDEILTTATTTLDIRYVHKTFYTFIARMNWIEDNLHPRVRQEFSEPFWLVFMTRIIQQATSDEIITRKDIAECKNDLASIEEVANFPDNRIYYSNVIFGQIRKLFSTRRSTLVGVILAFGLYGPSNNGSPPGFIEKTMDWLLEAVSSDFAFPAKWKSRNVILRTCFLNMLDIARNYERGTRSSYPYIYPAMQSYLNGVFAFHFLLCNTSQHVRLFARLIKDPGLEDVQDLTLAISQGLHGYFRDRLFRDIPTSRKQRDFLVESVLTLACEFEHERDILPFVEVLAINDCYMNCKHICNFLTTASSMLRAAYHTRVLEKLLPERIADYGSLQCSCQHQSQKVGLLYHWARFSSSTQYELLDQLSTYRASLVLLDFLLKLGIDINADCYSGGSVLHALLDDAVQPMPFRHDLNRTAKFLALSKRGVNPRAVGKNGTALQCAHTFKKRKSRWNFVPFVASNCDDVDVIINHLEFYDANSVWPSQFQQGEDERLSTTEDDESLADDLMMALIDSEPVTNHEEEKDSVSENEGMSKDKPESIEHMPLRELKEQASADEAETSSLASRDEFYAALTDLEPSEFTMAPEGFQDSNVRHVTPHQHSTTVIPRDHPSQSDEPLILEASHQKALSRRSTALSDEALEFRSVHERVLTLDCVAASEYGSVVSQWPESWPSATSSDLLRTGAPALESEDLPESSSHVQQRSNESRLEDLWDEQAIQSIVVERLIPRKVRDKLNQKECQLFMFVFQTLQSLGLRMSQEVDETIVYILEDLQFKLLRRAIIATLEIYDREDLLIELFEMERTLFEPLLQSASQMVGGQVSSSRSMVTALPSTSYETDEEEVGESSTPSISQTPQTPRNENNGMSRDSVSSIEPDLGSRSTGATSLQSTPKSNNDLTIRTNLGSSTKGHSRIDSGVDVLPEGIDSINDTLQSPRPPLPPRADLNKMRMPFPLGHRTFRDPLRRPSLVAHTYTDAKPISPSLKTKAAVTAAGQRYNRLLLDDLRWVITSELERMQSSGDLNQAKPPSRFECHELLEKSDWNFEEAVSSWLERRSET